MIIILFLLHFPQTRDYRFARLSSTKINRRVSAIMFKSPKVKIILFLGLLHMLRSFWKMATCKQMLVTPK